MKQLKIEDIWGHSEDLLAFYKAHLQTLDAEGTEGIWIHRLTDEEILSQVEALKNKERSEFPLWGVPFAVKDNIDVKNFPTTAACPDFRYFAEETAFVVERLIQAGAILIGKTNLDQFATGLVGTRSPYPIPKNPYNEDYLPGGSSSGSAVAVSRGLVCFSLGTDTAGSGRVPAAFNNIIGYKPSKGLLSTSGVFPACRSLDCVSLFANMVEDIQTVLPHAVCYDPADAFARPFASPAKAIALDDFTFGIPAVEQLSFFGDKEAQALFYKKVDEIKALGGTCMEVNFLPFLEAAKLLYEGPWVSERFVALEDLMTQSPESLLPVTRGIVSQGNERSAVEAFKSAYKLAELKRMADIVLSNVDLILTPTTGTCYKLSEVEAEPVQLNSNLGYYTNFMNLLDYAAIAIPAGIRTSNNVPFGVTLFSQAFTDYDLVSVAGKFNAETFEARVSQDRIDIVVCGAHLSGMPLNFQLKERGGQLILKTKTSKGYKLFALEQTMPARPALVFDESTDAQIEVEVWALPSSTIGSFLELIPEPLGLGKVKLEDGSVRSGFIVSQNGINDAKDITDLGSWRKYMA